MPHARKIIREAFVAAVIGLSTTGSKVYESRFYPMDAAALPGIIVYTKAEASENLTISRPVKMARQLDVAVEIYTKTVVNADDMIDQIALEIEQAVYTNSTLQGLAKDIRLTETDIKLMGEGEKPIAVATLTYSTLYHVLENDPATII